MRIIAFYTPSSIRQIRRFPFTSFGPAGFVVPARRQSENRTWTRRGGDVEETRSDRESPSGLISQTNAADWILACCKMDRSLWITDYRPPLPSISPRVVSFLRTTAMYIVLSSFALPAGPLRPLRRRFHLRDGGFLLVPGISTICHMPMLWLSLSLSLSHPVVVASQILYQW